MHIAFFISIYEWFKFGGRLIAALPYEGAWALPQRLIIFTLVWILSGLLNATHWVGFLLDEIFFRAYRKVSITRPLFVLGVPRSGTTWLQRVLAEDKTLCSFTTWECVFAPSITERYFWKAVACIFQPLIWLFQKLPFTWTNSFDNIHKIRLNEPEEDFLLLLPLHACFLLVLLCPNSSHYWKLAFFDEKFSANKRATIMNYYKNCIKKHMYFHGEDRQFLSKNPSFTPMLNSLSTHFPDAQFIACIRAPEKAVPSQLSSLLPAAKALGTKNLNAQFVQCMLGLLEHYYDKIHQNRDRLTLKIVDNDELCTHLKQVVQNLYRTLDKEMSAEYATRLESLDNSGKKYKSQHQYTLDNFGLTQAQLTDQFSSHWMKLTEAKTING